MDVDISIISKLGILKISGGIFMDEVPHSQLIHYVLHHGYPNFPGGINLLLRKTGLIGFKPISEAMMLYIIMYLLVGKRQI